MATRPITDFKRPTVGRIVHYVSYGTPGGEYQSECRAAIVTAVENPQSVTAQVLVGLCVVNPTGMFFHEHVAQGQGGTSTTPGAPTTPSYRGGTWHWAEVA